MLFVFFEIHTRTQNKQFLSFIIQQTLIQVRSCNNNNNTNNPTSQLI